MFKTDTNSGNRNSGDYNSGDYNSGDTNSGDYNSGYYNSGYYNSGYYNSGDTNSGDTNSGDYNSGDTNSGDTNSGDYNSGYGNSTNRESGIFNSEEPTIRIFNKPTNLKWNEIFHPHFAEFYLTKWISDTEMTGEEKKANPHYKVSGGYLKKFTYKEAWANFWKDTDEVNRKKFLALPNFSWDVFTSITGIKPENENCESEIIELNGIKYKKIKS